MADAVDLKSTAARHEGSNPSSPTRLWYTSTLFSQQRGSCLHILIQGLLLIVLHVSLLMIEKNTDNSTG